MWLLVPVKTLIRYWFFRGWKEGYITGCVKTRPPQPSMYAVPETWEKKCWRFFSWTEQRALFTATVCNIYVILGSQFFCFLWHRMISARHFETTYLSHIYWLKYPFFMNTSTFEEETTRFSWNTERHSPPDATLHHGITDVSNTPLQKAGTSTVHKK